MLKPLAFLSCASVKNSRRKLKLYWKSRKDPTSVVNQEAFYLQASQVFD